MRIGMERPSLEGAAGWLNWPADKAAPALQGQPALVHFWTLSRMSGPDNLKRLVALRDRYSAAGLRVIAVHLPRFPIEMNGAALSRVVAHLQLTEPCALDNRHKLRDAFHNEQAIVPAYYLFDAAGKLRSFASGADGLSIIAPALARFAELLPPRAQAAAAGQSVSAPQAFAPTPPAAAPQRIPPVAPTSSPLTAAAHPGLPVCPSCALTLEADSRFCAFCGQPVPR